MPGAVTRVTISVFKSGREVYNGAMDVIDFHLHVGTKDNWNPWVMDFFRQVNPFYHDNFSRNITPEGVLPFLDTQGVSRAVTLAEYAPKTTGIVTNEFIADFCRNSDRLIPFGAICLYDEAPYDEQAIRAVEDLGIRGFKMLPTYAHFYPNDRALFPFYDAVMAMKLPVMFHTGTSIFKGSLVKYGDPLFFDDVAEEFPDLTIILEHGGRPFWYDPAFWLVTRHPKIHIGIAGIPEKHLIQHFPHLERYPDRFIFGSDWPGIPDIKKRVEKILDLPYTTATKERILAGNAKNVLGF